MALKSTADVHAGMEVRVLSDLDEVVRLNATRLAGAGVMYAKSKYTELVGRTRKVKKIDPSDQTVQLEGGAWFVVEALFATDAADAPAAFGNLVLESMWKSRAFTDAELCCGDSSFRVHRAVLSAVSPVFAAMFSSSMKEGALAQITITDAPEVAVEALVEFLYKFQLAPSWPIELIELAHKYEIQPLLKKCCEHLAESVSSDTITTVLRVLRPRRDNVQVMQAWNAIMDKVCKEDGGMMVRAISEAV